VEKKPAEDRVGDATQAPLPAERAFVVQLRAQTDPGAELFVGRVEHIASGDAARFNSAQYLLAFIAKVLAPLPSSPGQPADSSSEGGSAL
jgi:hypothetical protein